jgi:anti-sigma factor RsiW
MHDIVVEELERHLSGDASQAFYDHLDACADCTAAVAALSEISVCLRELKVDEAVPEPSLGFYNRVANRIVEDQRKEAWGLFSPGAAFFRRVAFASLLILAGLGSFLVTREAPEGGSDAAAIIAAHDPTAAHSESADRDRLLVTLADYRQ